MLAEVCVDRNFTLDKRSAVCYNTAMAKSEKERKLRNKAIYNLGGQCACCGETEEEFMQFDHIHSTGSLARGLGQSTKKLLRKLAAGELGHAVQLLCANCHFSKTIHGECIHRRKNDAR